MKLWLKNKFQSFHRSSKVQTPPTTTTEESPKVQIDIRPRGWKLTGKLTKKIEQGLQYIHQLLSRGHVEKLVNRVFSWVEN